MRYPTVKSARIVSSSRAYFLACAFIYSGITPFFHQSLASFGESSLYYLKPSKVSESIYDNENERSISVVDESI